MLDACRTRAERDGFADRCEFHAGLVDTLPEAAAFDGAACFLVSQFLLDAAARTAFFAAIAKRSEEHTSELQSLMRISYAVFCLKKKHLYNVLTTSQRDT